MKSNASTRNARAEPTSGRLRGIDVLVVDDHDDARELIAIALGNQGARVTQADSVPAAMTAAASQEFNVLVSDIGMPGEDGYELVRRLHASDSEERQIPAVAVTAFAAPEDRAKALAAGFREHMSKPVDMLALVDLVARLAASTGKAAG